MNWVSPIKDDETLEKFKQELRKVDDKYYILFEIGVGTGLQLQEILKFRNKDIRDKDTIEACIGTKNIRRTFNIPRDLKEIIREFTEGKDPDAFLIQGHASSSTALSREQAYRVFKGVGKKETHEKRYESEAVCNQRRILRGVSLSFSHVAKSPISIFVKSPEASEINRISLYIDYCIP